MNQIPMLNLRAQYEYMKSDIDAALAQCLEHQRWIFGPEVKTLEDQIAGYLGVNHCIGTSSGTDALVLALRALAIKTKGEEYFTRDDLIITTPFTFTATGDAILRSGATPVFVDIDLSTYNIDTLKIREYLAESSELKAQSSNKVIGMIPVHLYGQSCDMNQIKAIAKEYNLFILEDVAQAFGGSTGSRQGSADSSRKLGSVGTAGAFSFFPSKNLGGCGDGGMVSTDDNQLASIVRMLVKHGGRDKYNVDHIGYNARLDTLQASILLAKLRYIDEFNKRRRKVASIYNEGLSGIDGLSLPFTVHNSLFTDVYHVFHQYTVRTEERDKLQTYLREKGISTMIYYPVPLHKMKVFDNRVLTYGTLENSEKASSEVLSLPVDPLQSEEDTQYVVESIQTFFKGSKV